MLVSYVTDWADFLILGICRNLLLILIDFN